MRRLIAGLLCGLSGCTLLLASSDHQGGSPASLDGSIPDGATADAGDTPDGGDGCDADRDGHRAKGTCGGDDCDDSRGDVHPGALPICGDGVVNDCDHTMDGALASQIMGPGSEDAELGIVPPRELGHVLSPAGARTVAIAMPPTGEAGGGVWIAYVEGRAVRERIPVLLHASGDAPEAFEVTPFPEPAVPFHDVTTVALSTGEGEPAAQFAIFAAKPFDSADADSTADTSGWVGTLGPAASAGTIAEINLGPATAKFSPRAVISGGSVKYPEHSTSLLETRGTAHYMGAFSGADASSYREVRTDDQGIVAAGGIVEAIGTRGPHLLLHEPGSADGYLWGYLANTPLKRFSLSTALDAEVTGRPGLAYLGQMTDLDKYALLAAGRGKVAAALIDCPETDASACALGLGGTTITINLDGSQDEALSVSSATLRESNLVAALARIRRSGSADEHVDLILLGLEGLPTKLTVLPEGFAGAGKRVLDAQIASMRSTLSGGQVSTTIGYAALVENDQRQDELHFGMLRACDER